MALTVLVAHSFGAACLSSTPGRLSQSLFELVCFLVPLPHPRCVNQRASTAGPVRTAYDRRTTSSNPCTADHPGHRIELTRLGGCPSASVRAQSLCRRRFPRAAARLRPVPRTSKLFPVAPSLTMKVLALLAGCAFIAPALAAGIPKASATSHRTRLPLLASLQQARECSVCFALALYLFPSRCADVLLPVVWLSSLPLPPRRIMASFPLHPP